MRGRKPPKVKKPRAPRQRKPTGDGKRIVELFGYPYYVITEGPEQSVLWSVDDHTDEFLTRENICPNTWFKPWRERLKVPRVKLKRRFTPGRSFNEQELRHPRIETREDE